MAKVNLSPAFMAATDKAMFNASEWKPSGEKISLKDIWNVTNPGLYENIKGNTAKIVAVDFADGNIGLRIEIPFKDDTSIQLKLSGRSELEEDDEVKIDTITGQELHKAGSEPIVRFDGEKVA